MMLTYRIFATSQVMKNKKRAKKSKGKKAKSTCLCYIQHCPFNFNGVYDSNNVILLLIKIMSRGSSVCIVSGCGLDDRRSRFDPSQRRKDFSCSLCVQTGSGAHPASCTMGIGGPFAGAKARPGNDADHSPPSSAEIVNE
jgi:hypothetical protein